MTLPATSYTSTRSPATTATYPGETMWTWAPSSTPPAGGPLVLLSHGAGIASDIFGSDTLNLFIGGTRSAWTLRIGPQIAAAGLTCVAIDGGGAATSGPTSGGYHWGSDAALDRMDAVVAAYGATRVALVGASMGGYVSLRWACRHPDKVASMCLLFPLSDMGLLWDGHPEHRTTIEAVWPDPHLAALNMTTRPEITGIPTRMWWSSNDTTIDPSSFAALAARIGAPCDMTPDGHAGHGLASPDTWPIEPVSSWIWDHAT